MYRLILSLTSALDGGGWQMQWPDHLNPRKKPSTRCTEGWTVWAGTKNFTPPEIDARTVKPIASRYTCPRYVSDVKTAICHYIVHKFLINGSNNLTVSVKVFHALKEGFQMLCVQYADDTSYNIKK